MMEEALIQTIQKIIDEKIANKVMPEVATVIELDREISKALNSLYKQGRIKTGQTINSRWITIN